MNMTETKQLLRGTASKFSFGLPVLKARLTGRPIPFQVLFTLTNRCNLKCDYCYADYPNRPQQKDLTLDEVLTIIDAFAEAGTRRFNLVGGEPMVRSDIQEIVSHIKDRRLECAMTTNGYYVRKKLDAVRRLDLLCVSLDGDRAAHDALRGEGSHAKAMEAIHLAVENRIPLQVACVLTRHNLNSIGLLLEMGREMGFAVGFSTLISEAGATARKDPPYLPNDEEYRTALRTILDYKKRGYPVLFSKRSLEYALRWPHAFSQDKIIGKTPDFKYIPCNAGRYFVIIDANGDVYPCPATVDVLRPLNALRDGVRKALDKTAGHTCKTCHIPCLNDFNLLYSLDAGVIVNILKRYQPRNHRWDWIKRTNGQSTQRPHVAVEQA
ncbi:MAG: radical SAM protein [Phycisphaerae bacterium]